ncbi:hypothetical protein ES705_50789 [subsurface metagenome]
MDFKKVKSFTLNVKATDDGIGNLSNNAFININIAERIKTSINGVFNKTDIKIYPNPCSNNLNIIFESHLKPDIIQIRLFDITGSMVLSEYIAKAGKLSIPVPDNYNGIYILQIIIDETIYCKKIIIK